MKNPRWKSGGILNGICCKVAGNYGRMVLKYKYHGDFKAFAASRKYGANYNQKHRDKITFENIKYGGRYDREKVD
jgi:hypothetical protein